MESCGFSPACRAGTPLMSAPWTPATCQDPPGLFPSSHPRLQGHQPAQGSRPSGCLRSHDTHMPQKRGDSTVPPAHAVVRKTARSYLRAPLRYDRAPPGTTTRRRVRPRRTTRRRVRPRRTPRRRTTGTRSPRPRPHTRRTSKHSGGCPPHFRVAGIRRRSDRAGSDACVRRLSGD